jgi:hypothetical protein
MKAFFRKSRLRGIAQVLRYMGTLRVVYRPAWGSIILFVFVSAEIIS